MPVFPTLRTLELHDFLPAPFTLTKLAKFLLEHPHLEEISVRKYRPSLENVTAPLALPAKLRKFSLEDNAHYAKPFLSSFYIPPDVDVILIRALDHMDHGDLGPSLREINLDVKRALTATRLLPDNRDLLPILPMVNKVTIRREFESFHSIVGTTPSGNVVELSGRSYDGAEHDIRDGLRLLRDVVDAFSKAPVVELCIESHGSSLIKEEDWILTLNAFPTLERLSIIGTGGGEWDARYTLLDALKSGSRKKSRGKKKAKARAASQVPALWPQLRSLTFLSDAWDKEDEELADELETCLKNRAERGSRLEELHLVLKYFRRPNDSNYDSGNSYDEEALDEEGAVDVEDTASEENAIDGENMLDELDEENTQRRDLYGQKLQNLVGHLRLQFVNRW